MRSSFSYSDLLNNFSWLFDFVSALQTLCWRSNCCCCRCWFSWFLARFHFLPEKWNSLGMSFFEKKTERIHRGSPPTVLWSPCTTKTHTYTHLYWDVLTHTHILTPTQKTLPHVCTHQHTLPHARRGLAAGLAAGLAGKHQTPGEEGGQAFPTFRLHGYFRCQAKNRANVNQTNAESTAANDLACPVLDLDSCSLWPSDKMPHKCKSTGKVMKLNGYSGLCYSRQPVI